MKKILIGAIAIAGFLYLSSNGNIFASQNELEPAGSGDGEIEITCKCTIGSKCKANGHGSNCAGGDNAKCWEWDGNC